MVKCHGRFCACEKEATNRIKKYNVYHHEDIAVISNYCAEHFEDAKKYIAECQQSELEIRAKYGLGNRSRYEYYDLTYPSKE